jgi:hypothetical protein|tara:strand:- start:3535 stop:3951 length:417 start_codon:yes stop_codon:yes gene_type:complete
MAVLSAAELQAQAELSYVRGTYYVALTNSNTAYTETTTYATIQADEVSTSNGGYSRLSYTYSASDVLAYSKGQPLSKKVATFIHDGTSGDISFNYVVLLREVSGTYSVVGFQKLSELATITTGNQAKIDISVLHGKGS